MFELACLVWAGWATAGLAAYGPVGPFNVYRYSFGIPMLLLSRKIGGQAAWLAGFVLHDGPTALAATGYGPDR